MLTEVLQSYARGMANIFLGLKLKFGSKKPKVGAFLAKISCLMPVLFLEVTNEPISMTHAMNNVSQRSIRGILRMRNLNLRGLEI